MTKDEIIEYLYENHTRADIKIEEMAEDLAEPVRKKGKWILSGNRLVCSECQTVPTNRITINGIIIFDMTPIQKVMKFCPNCGAEMSVSNPVPPPYLALMLAGYLDPDDMEGEEE